MTSPTNKRSFWPVAIISFFVLVILSIVAFIVWAVRQDMDLVRSDYYTQDINYQQQFDRDQRAKQLNSAATIDYDEPAQKIVITLPATQSHHNTTGFVHFYRPSDASLDRTVELAVNKDGTQQIDTKPFSAGHWKIRVYWKVNEEEFYFERAIILGGQL